MKALSIRQPWAWLILNGKDIENRSWYTRVRGRFLIHASKGMTHNEYEAAYRFVRSFNTTLALKMPLPHDLKRGGFIGSVELADVTMTSDSPWYTGGYGFVLRSPEAYTEFYPYNGQRRFFDVQTPIGPE